MTPRPAELPESEYESALRAAREGRCAAALEDVLRLVSEPATRASRAADAAGALGEIARLAEAAGELGVAERALEAALELKPRYADLHHRRATLLTRGGRFAEARRALDAALAINPRYVAARLDRAMLDARDGLVGEALESLRQLAAETAFDDPNAFEQGMEHLEQAEWDEADELLRRALRLEDVELRNELETVRALVSAGQAPEAEALLRGLVPRFAVYPDLHALLGRAQIALGHYDDAIASLARALELYPGYHAARVLLAHALEGAGQLAQAQEQIALVLQVEPANAEALERQREWARRGTRVARRTSDAR